ncbi:MAG: phosphoesterase [Caloramator sp.]|uniref:Phosphoesterase n=1 Tax=Caloramator proteoclasticus DSM 10124 TaxID=1121262 RepID=A0A1M4XEL8_9CLOT|nr:phosphodiesterase [Caloramator proteoclasticus]GIW49314.1 MAG: phosphoesterase [Caloramator sp.]SHE91871.1 hypothetical protein SAMN02746091_01397 [Caloramator proteoclasticus DSM 10124]
MKIGFISDIHGYPQRFKSAMELLKDADVVLCAGDVLYHGPRNPILEGYNPQGLIEEFKNNQKELIIARGNCDAEVDLMVLEYPVFTPVVFYEKDGVRFMVNHGHEYNDDEIKMMIDRFKIDVMVLGHTHIRRFEKYKDSVIINPGSISVPKGDGIPSFAYYEDGYIVFVNLNNGEIIEKNKI